jgi:CheY-like chemotaxis protein
MEALGTLASGFAHDFNNLLSGIFSYLTVIRMKTTDEEVLEPIELVYNIARRASTLVKHIVTFSRSSQIRAVHVNICHTVDEIVAMIRESFPKNIELENTVCDRDCWILGDPSQIAQVLLNLCINARDAMPSGGTLTISLERMRISEEDVRRFRMLQAGNTVRITVSDTGMGIDPTIADKIFDPFFTTKSDRNGTGMGLFIVYGILRSHRGDIELTSNPGRGTAISIYLPLTEPPNQAEIALSPVVNNGKQIQREHKGRLIVIDDEEIIGGALREGFGRMGFEVRTAISGEEGLRLCRESLPDLVILDMIMPGLGGEETFDKLKHEFPSLKVVIHTGFTQGDVEQRMLDKGALDVLHKPYEMLEVAERVAEWIRSSEP